MKKIFNLHNLSLLLVVAIVSVFTIVKVNATVAWDNTTHGSATIERTVEHIGNPVVTTFTYTVTADNANPAGATGAPSSGTVVFDGSETITSGSVVETGTLDFSSMTFARPGTYHYTVAETATTNNLYPLDSDIYDIYIQVTNELDANNQPTGNFNAVMVKQNREDPPVKVTNLTFESSPEMSHIDLSKIVTGTGADATKYFPVSITINAPEGTYPITGTFSTDGTTAATSANYVVPSTGATAMTIYMKHGDSVTIGNNGTDDLIPTGVSYTFAETNDPDYTEKYKVNSGTQTEGTTCNGTVAATANSIQFDNSLTSTPITGVLLNIIPYVLVIVIAVSGTLIYTALKTKKQTA